MTIVAHPATNWFMSKVSVSEGCWEWRAAKDPTGYGACKFEGRKQGAHRVAHLIFKGDIAGGMWIDHLCRNRGCVNPAHLEAVSPAENTRRGLAPIKAALRSMARTQCPQGHPLEGDNLAKWSATRRCLTCMRTQRRESAARRREAGATY